MSAVTNMVNISDLDNNITASLGYMPAVTGLDITTVANLSCMPAVTDIDENIAGVLPSTDTLHFIIILYIYHTLRLVLCIAGTTGNLIILISMKRFTFLKGANNIFIASVAITDILTNMSAPFAAYTDLVTYEHPPLFWIYMCYIKELLYITGMVVNYLHMFIIALDRCLAVHFPIWYLTKVSRKVILAEIVFLWFFAILLFDPLVLGYARFARFTCFYVNYLPAWFLKFMYIIAGFFMVSTIVLYLNIAHTAWIKFRKSAPSEGSTSQQTTQQRQQRRILQMMGTVVGIYLALYIPGTLVNLLPQRAAIWYLSAKYLSWIMFYCNAVVNPIIYVYKSPDFLRAFRKLLGLKPLLEGTTSTCSQTTSSCKQTEQCWTSQSRRIT